MTTLQKCPKTIFKRSYTFILISIENLFIFDSLYEIKNDFVNKNYCTSEDQKTLQKKSSKIQKLTKSEPKICTNIQ